MRLVELPQYPSDATKYGAKAANLAVLRTAGLRIPPTWVVQGLPSKTLPMRAPSEVAIVVQALLKRYGSVIVRSSASIEDGSIASFAGQFASFRASSAKRVWEAICECIRSQTARKTLAYAGALRVEAGNLVPGVIVQPFIEPTFAGVGFTQGDEIVVIESVRGHSELLVAGLVTPERYVLRDGDLNITPADQQLFAFAFGGPAFPADLVESPFSLAEAYIVEADALAGVVYASIPDLVGRPVLSTRQADELRALLLRTRSAFGQDVDVEWVFSEGFTLVQARPATRPPLTLYESVATNTSVDEGQCASPGEAEAPAFVSTAHELTNDLPTGHILVTQATSPEHTPALLRAAGVVAEQGGLLSHTAIVCRELGIPCIVGRRHATREVRTGERVRLVADQCLLAHSDVSVRAAPAVGTTPPGRLVQLVTDANRVGREGDSLLLSSIAHADAATLNPQTRRLTLANRTLMCSIEPGYSHPMPEARLVLHDHRAYLEVL